MTPSLSHARRSSAWIPFCDQRGQCTRTGIAGEQCNHRGKRSASGRKPPAAATLKLRVHIVHASTVSDFDAACAALRDLRVGALVIGTDTFFNSQSLRLGELTRRHGIPAIYQYREFTAGGGLMSYAGSISDAYRAIGVYAGRILQGEKPGDLPV